MNNTLADTYTKKRASTPPLNLSLGTVCAGTAKVSQVKSSSNAPKALIIEPSKELAEQTLNNVKQFKKYVENPKLRHDFTFVLVPIL